MSARTDARSQADALGSGPEYDCDDFAIGAAAQKVFLAAAGSVSDQHDLDRDGDGLACEWGTELGRIADYRPQFSVITPRNATKTCYTGARGGTYTRTPSGAKTMMFAEEQRAFSHALLTGNPLQF